jgi:hypothetical protein
MTNEAIVSSIEQLQNSLNNKFEDTIQIVSTSSNIRQKLLTPLKLDPSKNYKIGVKYFATYNNIGNITSDNNELHYLYGPGSYKTVVIEPGAYEIKDLNERIQEKIPGELVQILPHKPTGKVELKLKEGTKVHFGKEKSFYYMLGFDKKEYTESINIAENRARINVDRSLINIKSNLINSGMLTTENNMIETRNILFSIPTFTVPSNYKIIETPYKPEYLSITSSTISEICLQIVDENDKLYDFNGEKIVIKLHIKQV